MSHRHYFTLLYGEWVLILAMGAFLAVIIGIIWLFYRRTMDSRGLTPLERKTLTSPEQEILSMLRQNGGPMRQDEMVDELSGDLEMLSEVLKDLETKGRLQRKWEPGQGTYIVSMQS